MEGAVFQQREPPVTSPESVTPETAISLFASAFQELQSVSPGERNAHATRPGQPIINVNALPTRIKQWFEATEEELDWSAPIACIATLKWRPPLTPTSSALQTRPDRIEAILTKDQVSYLLHQFQEKYGGWLGFTVVQEAHSPLIGFVCCTVSSRHLPQDQDQTLTVRLQSSMNNMIGQVTAHPELFSGSSTAIKALLVKLLFLPTTIDEEQLLLSLVIDMAQSLRLQECADRLLHLRRLQIEGRSVDERELVTLMDHSRLWSWIINTSLLYSIGTGTTRLSSQSEAFPSIFTVSHVVPSDSYGCLDIRSRLLGDILRTATLTTHPNSVSMSDVAAWLHERQQALRTLVQLRRLCTPYSVLADHGKFQFGMLCTTARLCQLIIHYDIIFHARKVYGNCPQQRENPNNPLWFLEVQGFDPSLIFWMKDGLVIAEEILVWILEIDVDCLTTIPDHIFLFFSFAASYLIGVKFIMLNALQVAIPGVDSQLLVQVVAMLRRAAVWPGHPAERCANFISILVSLWEHRDVVFGSTEDAQLP